jgi:hypothetical protein
LERAGQRVDSCLDLSGFGRILLTLPFNASLQGDQASRLREKLDARRVPRSTPARSHEVSVFATRRSHSYREDT